MQFYRRVFQSRTTGDEDMDKKRFLLTLIILSSLLSVVTAVQAQTASEYISPAPGATMVRPGTTIAIRPGQLLDERSLANALFQVVGTLSGRHEGQIVLADDQRTIIFKPNRPFDLGENVTVTVAPGLTYLTGKQFAGVSFAFSIQAQIAPNVRAGANDFYPAESHAPLTTTETPSDQPNSKYLTLPTGFPSYTVTVPANGTGDGDLFMAPFTFAAGTGLNPYLLVLDNMGEPVYYKRLVQDTTYTDFKRQPNGDLTYFDGTLGLFVELDSSYNVVNSYQAGNGYNTDVHELQILPNGHSLLMSEDPEIATPSQIAAGVLPTATVLGLVVQELDSMHNVVFQWRSWDHFSITDTYESLTTPLVDYVHGNAIELDNNDGNLLISSRHMSEITKIDRQTGNIIWRLGGKNNQFTFTDTDNPQMFAYQHDIRRLPNGNITLWDNRDNLLPVYSRAVEYELDEPGKNVTRIWQYRNSPDTFSGAMGDAQRLSNGNTVVGWGAVSAPAVTEVKPDGSKAFELAFQPPYVSYRAFRLPWHGYPTTTPTLVTQTDGVTTTLAYSWNGATEIGSYRLYGGDTPYPTTLIATQPKTAFEDRTVLVNEPQYCYFRVLPVDNQGHDTTFSNVVFTGQACFNGKVFLPSIMQ
jgi:hypothetical protein